MTTLRQRELAKVAELAAQGQRVSLATVQRLRRRYQQEGLWALVDHRVARQASATGRVDPRIVQAARQAIAEETDRSTGTVSRLRRRTQQLLAARLGPDAPPMPSQRTFYRLAARLSEDSSFQRARERAGLPETLTLHALRHSYVTHLVEAGYDPMFVQQQVGHSYSSTTALYTSVSSDFKQKTIQRMIARRIARPQEESDV